MQFALGLREFLEGLRSRRIQRWEKERQNCIVELTLRLEDKAIELRYVGMRGDVETSDMIGVNRRDTWLFLRRYQPCKVGFPFDFPILVVVGSIGDKHPFHIEGPGVHKEFTRKQFEECRQYIIGTKI